MKQQSTKDELLYTHKSGFTRVLSLVLILNGKMITAKLEKEVVFLLAFFDFVA